MYKNKSSKNIPLYVRLHSELKEIDINQIDLLSQPENPPWMAVNIWFDLTLHRFKKQCTNPLLYKQEFLSLINTNYATHYKIYTDGSIKNERSAFAIMTEDHIIEERIGNYSSIYVTELKAIKKP